MDTPVKVKALGFPEIIKVQEQLVFLRELVYTIRDSRMMDQDIRPYLREKLIQFEGDYY